MLLMSGLEFREKLAEAGVSQAAFSRLSGFTRGAVNRWCSPDRPDYRPPPRIAAVVLILLCAMPPQARAATIAALTGGTDE
jgi:hypothetical protein